MKGDTGEMAEFFYKMFIETGVLNLLCAVISYFMVINFNEPESVFLNAAAFVANYVVGSVFLIGYIRRKKND